MMYIHLVKKFYSAPIRLSQAPCFGLGERKLSEIFKFEGIKMGKYLLDFQ